jgi:hypothetical protein
MLRRMHFVLDDIEPQSKKMSDIDRDRFQNGIASQLKAARRSTFKADLALKLDVATTSKNAPQAHTIAKNFLDLLGQRRPNVTWPRRSLLYDDDRQIQALSILCRHGECQPDIRIEARPFSGMLDDLELAARAVNEADDSLEESYRERNEFEWVGTLRKLVDNSDTERHRLGDSLYDAYFKMVRWNAQQALFSRSGVGVPVLGWMYGLPKGIPTGFSSNSWAKLIAKSKLRLQLGGLPIASGESARFKQDLAAEILRFQQRWNWIISPLVIAVGIEVLVRPSPDTPPSVLHDLDNIVRDYLLPSIIPSFGTVSDSRWTIDLAELRKSNPKLAADLAMNPTPPAGTKSGVTRYEAWRLPPVAGEPGFVSVALTGDLDGRSDLMSRMDASIKRWSDERTV